MSNENHLSKSNKITIRPAWITNALGNDEVNDGNLVDCFNGLFNNMISTTTVLCGINTDDNIAVHGVPGISDVLANMAEEGKEVLTQWHENRRNETVIQETTDEEENQDMELSEIESESIDGFIIDPNLNKEDAQCNQGYLIQQSKVLAEMISLDDEDGNLDKVARIQLGYTLQMLLKMTDKLSLVYG